jgi:hypothetical protein
VAFPYETLGYTTKSSSLIIMPPTFLVHLEKGLDSSLPESLLGGKRHVAIRPLEGIEITSVLTTIHENWTRVHYSLLDETPAMALCLTNDVWTILKYILYPVHVSDFNVRTGPSSVKACWNQPLMFINVIKLYQYHEVVPNFWIS